MQHTLREIASLIATCEGRDGDPIYNQLRGLSNRDILQALPDQYGKKGAKFYLTSEVFRARMLIAALDTGFASGMLARFDAQMRSESRSLDPITGQHYSRSFDAAVSDLFSEKPMSWIFEVARIREGEELKFSGYWIADNVRRGHIPDWSEHRPGFEGITNFAFSDFCAPLLRAMQAEG